MKSVREWAALKKFDYIFIDDRLFDYAPRWYREKVCDQVQLVSDLARLELAKEFLSEGFERAVWVDADVLVFNAAGFDLAVTEEYAFCREVWVEKIKLWRALHYGLSDLKWPGLYCRQRVNNSVSIFVRGNSLLDFYIHSCKRLVKNASGPISNLEVGTLFLTELHKTLRLPLLNNVGLFSPAVMRDIALGTGKYLKAQIRAFASPVMAANLCASYANKEYDGVAINDQMYDLVLDRLMETEGEIVNRILRERPEPVSPRRDAARQTRAGR